MEDKNTIAASPFDRPDAPISLYDYAPVLRVRDRAGDWVLKRTGQVHSDGTAIGRWLAALKDMGVDVVAPATHFQPNSRGLDDGAEWVVYPFVPGSTYRATTGEQARAVSGLPLAGCSFDFKATNLVFNPTPTLVDSDHAARMPRLQDLAIALLLFHCDLPTAPGRLWTRAEWLTFMRVYQETVALTSAERSCWPTVVTLVWLDQAIWLLGNWPEAWADSKARGYLLDLAAFDPDYYAID